jgi:FkbM family methyltransferase
MRIKKLKSYWHELNLHPGFRRHPATVLGRIATWTLLCALRIAPRARFRRWGFTLQLPSKWLGGGATWPYLYREDYVPELALMERFLAPGMVFIDGGANCGVYTFLAARLVGPSGRVLAFEPGAACFAALEKSSTLNRFQQVVLRKQALADQNGIARFYHHGGQDNMFGLGQAAEDGVPYDEVETITIEKALEELQLNHLDFLKLDIEGAQEMVLRSSKALLQRCRPVLLIELDLDSSRLMNLDPDDTLRVLVELGYTLHTIDEQGEIHPLQFPRQSRRVLAILQNT